MNTHTSQTEAFRKLNEVYDGLLECQSVPSLPNGLPRYLFRGERDGYPDTLTSMDRHYHVAEIDEEVYDELDDLTAFVMLESFSDKGLKAREAGAYAQHYGLPTQIFDFTASAKIAIAFSANRSFHSDKAIAGNIAILDVARALEAGCIVEDLRNQKFAKRAKIQDAFGVIYTGFIVGDFCSLKDQVIMNKIGLVWVPFSHLENDEEFLRSIEADSDILSVENDPFASLAQEFVDEYVKRNGPFSEKAAQILSGEIPNINRTRDENYKLWTK